MQRLPRHSGNPLAERTTPCSWLTVCEPDRGGHFGLADPEDVQDGGEKRWHSPQECCLLQAPGRYRCLRIQPGVAIAGPSGIVLARGAPPALRDR